MVDEYKDAIAKAENELEQLIALHGQTEKRIANLRLTLNGLRQLAAANDLLEGPGILEISSPATVMRELGFTDSIRQILKAKSPLYSSQIKAELVNLGFDPLRYDNFMAAVNIVLKRLITNGEVDTTKDRDGNTRFAYVPTEQQRFERVAQAVAKKKKKS